MLCVCWERSPTYPYILVHRRFGAGYSMESSQTAFPALMEPPHARWAQVAATGGAATTWVRPPPWWLLPAPHSCGRFLSGPRPHPHGFCAQVLQVDGLLSISLIYALMGRTLLTCFPLYLYVCPTKHWSSKYMWNYVSSNDMCISLLVSPIFYVLVGGWIWSWRTANKIPQA